MQKNNYLDNLLQIKNIRVQGDDAAADFGPAKKKSSGGEPGRGALSNCPKVTQKSFDACIPEEAESPINGRSSV